MLPPLFLSVRLPTLLVILWRSRFLKKAEAKLLHAPQSVIIFRLDAMGDVVMTTPLFRELKHTFPNSRCAVVVRREFRPLLDTNPYIDEIFVPPKLNDRVPRRARDLIAAWLLYWKHLRGRRFDIGISPRWDLDEYLATFLCTLTNCAVRVGYSEKASPRKQRLNRGFDAAFNLCLEPGPLRHEVLRNLAIVETLGGAVRESRPDLHLTDRNRVFATQLLANVPAATALIAIGIGATSPGRCWPLCCYAETISRLKRERPILAVLVCSANERERALQLNELLNWEAIVLCGAPLRKVCAVLERCHLFIGNDSGPAHLAAAMGCKTIVISRHPRNGDPNHANSPLRFGPPCGKVIVLQPESGLDICTDSCEVTEPHCITAVSVEEVVDSTVSMLGKNRAEFDSTLATKPCATPTVALRIVSQPSAWGCLE
jgi:ADP-heptose:LPS heptosyltransferase